MPLVPGLHLIAFFFPFHFCSDTRYPYFKFLHPPTQIQFHPSSQLYIFQIFRLSLPPFYISYFLAACCTHLKGMIYSALLTPYKIWVDTTLTLAWIFYFHLAYQDRALLAQSTESTTLAANQHTASISQSAAAYQDDRRDALGKCL